MWAFIKSGLQPNVIALFMKYYLFVSFMSKLITIKDTKSLQKMFGTKEQQKSSYCR